MGAITEMATAAPGNSSIRPRDKAPVAETLKLNGYSTAQFGKCHQVPFWEISPVGPFTQWPTGSGFEHFYGFIGKFDDGWDVLRENTVARQRKIGVIPKDAEIPAWHDMSDELKPVLARQMELYAGFLEQTDLEVGRVIDAIDDLGILGDTLVYHGRGPVQHRDGASMRVVATSHTARRLVLPALALAATCVSGPGAIAQLRPES